MTTEARLAFVLFFFAAWCVVGLIAWAVAAVVARGRGALPALPLALAAASVAGVAVPLLGARDLAGFFFSFLTAAIGGALGSAGGIALARRIGADGRSTDAAQRKIVRARTVEQETGRETD